MKNNKALIIFIISIVLLMAGIIIFKPKDQKADTSNSANGFELLTTKDFNKEDVLARGYPTMLDIGGAECVPCKAMKPVLDELNKEWQGKAIVKFVDYWKYPKLANQFEFKVIPTQFFYDKNGKLFKTHEGGITKEEVITIFKEMGYDFNG